MNHSIVSGAFQTARSTILICIAGTACIVIALLSERIVFERYYHDASGQIIAAASVAADLLLTDERLTQSANLAAASGERLWVERYKESLPEIEVSIRQASAMASPEDALQFQEETKEANDALVDMETQSFRAVEAGNLSLARSILNSDGYLSQKQTFAAGTSRLLKAVISQARNRLDSVRWVGRLALSSLGGLGVLAYALLCVMTARRVKIS